MVCIACLLPLFLIPVVNALPFLFDLILGCFLVSSAGASNEAGMSMKVEGLVLHGDALHGEKEFRRALIIPPGVEFGHIIHDFDMDGEEENPSPASEDPPYSL